MREEAVLRQITDVRLGRLPKPRRREVRRLLPRLTRLVELQEDGLAEGRTVALESANFPGYYLRDDNGEVWLRRGSSTADFRNGAGAKRDGP